MTQKKKKPHIVAVIPCYNEALNIRRVTLQTLEHVDQVIVVDDGSTDNTIDQVTDLKAIVKRHSHNMGKGCALRTGFSAALNTNADIIITLDGDGQHPPSKIPEFVHAIQHHPSHIVLGSRFLGETKHMPWLRKFTNGVTNRFTRLLLRVPVTDLQSGYRAFRREVLECTTTIQPRFVMESEILIDAKRLGFKITEIPIATIYGVGEQSKMRPTREAKEWILMVIQKLFVYPDKELVRKVKSRFQAT